MNDDACPLCGGEPAYLGRMGRLLHLRCRDCGWVYSQPIPQPEVTEWPADTLPMEQA